MEYTKEQLFSHIEGVINTFTDAVRTYPDNIGLKMDLRTAEIALAALKAKPVPGLFMKSTEIEPCPGKETIAQAMPMADGQYHESCFHLYDVPPVQVIPEEIIDEIVKPIYPDGLDEVTHHCEWALYKDRERIRKGLREYYSAQPAPSVPEELLSAMEEVLRISDRDHDAWHKAKCAIASCRATMRQDDNEKDKSAVCY